MKPIDFPEANFTFTAPANMPEVLPLRAHVSEAGITQCWEVSPEDLEVIKTTGKIYVHLRSQYCPPLGLCVNVPFPAPEFPEGDDAVIVDKD